MQRKFTDAESRIQKSGDGFVQGYNAQIAVDAEAQIIVAQALTHQPPDVQHLVPLLERVRENYGATPATLSADAGYFSGTNVEMAQGADGEEAAHDRGPRDLREGKDDR